MTQDQILKNYESAKAVYKDWGVDVEKVLEELAKIIEDFLSKAEDRIGGGSDE